MLASTVHASKRKEKVHDEGAKNTKESKKKIEPREHRERRKATEGGSFFRFEVSLFFLLFPHSSALPCVLKALPASLRVLRAFVVDLVILLLLLPRRR